MTRRSIAAVCLGALAWGAGALAAVTPLRKTLS